MRQRWRAKPIGWRPHDVEAYGNCVRRAMAEVRSVAKWQCVARDASEALGYFPQRGERERPRDDEKATSRAAQLTSGLPRWEHLQRLWRLRRRQRAQAVMRATLEHQERDGWGKRGLPEAWGTFGVAGLQGSQGFTRDRAEMGVLLTEHFGGLFADSASADPWS